MVRNSTFRLVYSDCLQEKTMLFNVYMTQPLSVIDICLEPLFKIIYVQCTIVITLTWIPCVLGKKKCCYLFLKLGIQFNCMRSNNEPFHFLDSGLRCELSTGSVSALKTSQLLCDYRKIDSRVHMLAMTLRYWARLCGVDSQSDGSMPAYSFVLMTIYFLKHCKPPVVPVLQEV